MFNSMRSVAESILRENDRGLYTIPSARLYPHQWAWDSAFAAVGWAHLDLERACVELETLLGGQWEDGRVPHILFHQDTPDYFPGPGAWGAGGSSSITNPPVWTLAAEKLLALGVNKDRLRAWLPALDRSHQFLGAHRDPLGWKVVATAHPWENGQDNCPAWDEPLLAVDSETAPPFQRVDKGRVEDAAQRPTDIQYKRYMALVQAFIENGYQMADFAVYDPFFTTMTILAEEALGRMGEVLGYETEAFQRAAALRQGLESRLWSEEHGRYGYYDARGERYLYPHTIGSVAPAILGQSVQGYDLIRKSLRTDFATPWGLPSVAPSSPYFDPVRYWRGPSWININWLFRGVLGTDFARQTLQLVKKTGYWEYFHPLTGKGLGADRFTWTAALVLDLLHEGEWNE